MSSTAQLLPQSEGVSLKAQVSHIADAVAKAPNAKELQEGLAASLLVDSKIPTYSKRIRDPRSGESVDVSPYAKAAPGATSIVTTIDPQTHEIYVLLGRKQKNKHDPKEGLADFIAPGGYMESLPPEGATQKEIDASDFNLAEASRRELQEETGLAIPDTIAATSLGTNSDADQNPNTQSVNEFFHYSLSGTPDSLPAVMGKDDLKVAQWINAKDIIRNEQVGAQPAGSEHSRYQITMQDGSTVNLRDLHGGYVEKAIEQARQQVQNMPRLQSTAIANDNTQISWRDKVLENFGNERNMQH